MNEAMDPTAPVIGACLNCRSLFLVLPETPNCLLCGRPPTYTLILTPVPLKPAEEAPDEPVEYHPSTAPPEELPPAVGEQSPAAGEEAPGNLMLNVPTPILALFRGITEFMEGAVEDSKPVYLLFRDAGATPSEALNAGSQLRSVRDLTAALWERGHAEPTAPMQPQPEGPDEEA